MRALVTGCSSYIGKEVANELLMNNLKVCGLSRKNPKIYSKNFTWTKGDLTKIKKNNLKDKFDFIIHIAGTPIRKNFLTKDYVEKNIFITLNLVKLFEKNPPKAVIYLSSREVYGEVSKKVLTEETNVLVKPHTYGVTKYLAEKILMDKYKTISLRLPAVLGQGSHGWLANLIQDLKKNKKIIFSNSKFNNCIHVSDLSKIIFSLIKKTSKKSEIFNVACSKPIMSKKIVMLLKKKLNSKSKIISRNNNKAYYFSTNKLSKIYRPLKTMSAIKKYLDEQK